MVVTKSRRRNKKNQEKVNNSPSYRCAAIKNLDLERTMSEFGKAFLKKQKKQKINIKMPIARTKNH